MSKKYPIIMLGAILANQADGMSAFNKRVLFVTAATASASAGYGKRAEIENKIDDARIDILKQDRLRAFRQFYPKAFQALVADPLLKKVPYSSLSEYVQEGEEATQRRQTIAKTLCLAGISLGVSQTEADILTYDYNKSKKELVSDGVMTTLRIVRPPSVSIVKQKVAPSLKDLDAMLKAEKNICSQGNQVLYHGMHPAIYAHDHICTKLQAINEASSPQFLNLRPQARQPELQADGSMRAKILQRNGYNLWNEKLTVQELPSDHDSMMRKYLISCSPAILSGTSWLKASCESALYFSLNSYPVVGSVYLEPVHGSLPAKILKKYNKRLEEAQHKFSQRCLPSGVMLQISLSPALTDKTVYPALSGGYRHNVYTKDSSLQKLEKTSEIFTEVRNNPFNLYVKHTEHCSGIDSLQLRLIVDGSLLLNPSNPEVRDDFKVKAYAINNQAALDEFHHEVDEIVTEIRSELNKH